MVKKNCLRLERFWLQQDCSGPLRSLAILGDSSFFQPFLLMMLDAVDLTLDWIIQLNVDALQEQSFEMVVDLDCRILLDL